MLHPIRLLLCATVAALVLSCGKNGSFSTRFLTADANGVGFNLQYSGGGQPPVASGGGSAATGGRQAIQREIEEADLHRLDGELLYLVNAYRGLAIVDLGRLELVGRLAIPGVPLEMFLRGSRAFVLVAARNGDTEVFDIDLTTPATPTVLTSATVSDPCRTSRLIGDVLYVAAANLVQSFDVGVTPLQPVTRLAHGSGIEFAQIDDTLGVLTATTEGQTTRIDLVDVSDPSGAMRMRGRVEVPGQLSDDQRFDREGEVLRVVTFDGIEGMATRLHTIDIANPDAPVILGRLTFGRNERLFATRFTIDRCYVVTFEQIDPLWVIDLTDPHNPWIAGELEVPGFSTQIVADGNQLIALGVDPALDNRTVLSLFDVTDPTRPVRLDHEVLATWGSTALWDRKAMTVASDRVLVPMNEGLAVVRRTASSIELGGTIPVASGALRGFAYGDEIVAYGLEQVVVADAATLASRGAVTIASNVVDIARLADGRLLELVQSGDHARCGGADLELWAESMHPFGNAAAIIGWDARGRAAYVVDFAASPPTVGLRLPIGWGGFGTPSLPAAMRGLPTGSAASAFIAAGFVGPDALMTTSGKLAIRGGPEAPRFTYGGGRPTDGFSVIDIPKRRLARGITFYDATITGAVVDGASLAFTYGRFAGNDSSSRPLLRHDFVRVDLDREEASHPRNVPGFVVAVDGADLFTIAEEWTDSWTVRAAVVASRIDASQVTVSLDRYLLPVSSFDFRAAGHTLCFSALEPDSLPWPHGWWSGGIPMVAIHSVRLGPKLAAGPDVSGADAFRSILLVEDGAVLSYVHPGTIERWDLSGATATRDFASASTAWQLHVHRDPAAPGHYLIASGYAGGFVIP